MEPHEEMAQHREACKEDQIWGKFILFYTANPVFNGHPSDQINLTVKDR
jgi:hypothetical protein